MKSVIINGIERAKIGINGESNGVSNNNGENSRKISNVTGDNSNMAYEATKRSASYGGALSGGAENNGDAATVAAAYENKRQLNRQHQRKIIKPSNMARHIKQAAACAYRSIIVWRHQRKKNDIENISGSGSSVGGMAAKTCVSVSGMAKYQRK